MNGQRVLAWRERKGTEHPFTAYDCLGRSVRCDISKRQDCAADRRLNGGARTGFHGADQGSKVLRLLAGKSRGRAWFSRLLRFLEAGCWLWKDEKGSESRTNKKRPVQAESKARRARGKCLHSVGLRAQREHRARLANNTYRDRATTFRTA